MAGAFLPLSKYLSRRFQHVLDEDPVPHRGIIHKNVSVSIIPKKSDTSVGVAMIPNTYSEFLPRTAQNQVYSEEKECICRVQVHSFLLA